MSGHVVKYAFIQVISTVLAARNPSSRIAQTCVNGITPEILRFWEQQYARSSTESLKRLAEVYDTSKVSHPKEVVTAK